MRYYKLRLTNGGYALVDDCDALKVGFRKWYLSGKRVRCTRTKQELSRYIVEPEPGMVVDHINGDTLDNRRENLRVCTLGQNSINKRGKLSDTGYIGVTRDKRSKNNLFHAAVHLGRKKHYIGSFRSAREAAIARDAAAQLLHKEFAVYNFPEIFG